MKNNKTPTILAIDTSCDDTSAAVVQGRRILSNIISSQEDLHRKYGGVMPSLAKLEHSSRIDSVVNEALKRARVSFEEIDALAVTRGPGLAISLEVGISHTLQISRKYKLPIISVNHMEGHLLSALAQNSQGNGSTIPEDTAINNWLGLLISGGHTEFIQVNGIGNYAKIGQTMDDACGEAFDKSARVLGLGYPGGSVLSELAKQARLQYPTAQRNKDGARHVYIPTTEISQLTKVELSLPVPMANSGDLRMSFSGIKTAFWQLTQRIKLDLEGKHLDKQQKDTFREERVTGVSLPKTLTLALCLLFETAAIEQLKMKLDLALKLTESKHVLVGGGVVNNTYGRRKLRGVCRKHSAKLHFPYSKKLFIDNAAMIGLVGYYKFTRNEFSDPKDMDRLPTWAIDT